MPAIREQANVTRQLALLLLLVSKTQHVEKKRCVHVGEVGHRRSTRDVSEWWPKASVGIFAVSANALRVGGNGDAECAGKLGLEAWPLSRGLQQLSLHNFAFKALRLVT